jgi:hypothetical protein
MYCLALFEHYLGYCLCFNHTYAGASSSATEFMHVWMHSCIVSVICFLIYIISRGSSTSCFIKKKHRLTSSETRVFFYHPNPPASSHVTIKSSPQTNFNSTLRMQKSVRYAMGGILYALHPSPTGNAKGVPFLQ